jgi:hypothetical protein
MTKYNIGIKLHTLQTNFIDYAAGLKKNSCPLTYQFNRVEFWPHGHQNSTPMAMMGNVQ